jgi:hypothetical protein
VAVVPLTAHESAVLVAFLELVVLQVVLVVLLVPTLQLAVVLVDVVVLGVVLEYFVLLLLEQLEQQEQQVRKVSQALLALQELWVPLALQGLQVKPGQAVPMELQVPSVQLGLLVVSQELLA